MKYKVGMMDELRGQIEEALDKTADEMGEVWDDTICRIEEIMEEVLGKMEMMLNRVGHDMSDGIDDQEEGEDDEMEICDTDGCE